MKVFTVNTPLFKVEPLFVLGATPEQLQRYLARRKWRVDVTLTDTRGLAGACFTFDRTPWRVVWTRKLDLGVVLHEVFHLVTRICYDRGIPIRAYDEMNQHGDETAAYLMEHFGSAALRRLR